MNHIFRSLAAVAALGLATAAMATGPAAGADLLLAPTGAAAGDPGAWTSVVARSYQPQYSDVQCLTLPAPSGAEATYDLGAAPSGEWAFAVVATETGNHQYGPAEFIGTGVPAGAGSTGVIGCHGTPESTPPAATVPATVASGLEGGRSGLVVLGVGAVLVAGLALLGRRARA